MSRLAEERLKRNLSQARIAEIADVAVSTVSRWECGNLQPHGERREKLCSFFGMSARELGIAGGLPFLPTPINDSIAELVALPFSSHAESFHQCSLIVRILSEQAMQTPSRRAFLKGTLSSLVFLPLSNISSSSYHDLLHHCTAGLASAQEMSKSTDADDLRIAYDAMGIYSTILQSIAHNSSSLRLQSLDLLARCSILQVILGWHVVGEAATVPLAEHALSLSKDVYEASGDPSLPLSAYSKMAWALSYRDEDYKALQTATEARDFLLKQDTAKVPIGIRGGTWSTLALMQAKAEESPDEALGKATEEDPGDDIVAFMEYTKDDIPLESGLVRYASGDQQQAMSAIEEIIDPHTLQLKPGHSLSERGRLSAIHTMAQVCLEKPDRDLEQIQTYCQVLATGAHTLQSEYVLGKARNLHRDMKIAFPGERLELRPLMAHW